MVNEQVEVRELSEGGYVLVDDVACHINSISKSKPGKHGSAKARVEVVGVFDGQKRNFTQPVNATVRRPIVERKSGQVLSVSGDEAQVMDLDSYATVTFRLPDGVAVAPDDEIDYLDYDGQRKVV
jgi:translation initiation factor 5A